MYTLLMIIHVIISAALVLVILTQSGKGGALDGMLGGAATNTLGGQNASSFLQNATKILATLFMVSCILLAFNLKGKQGGTKTSKALEKVKSEAVADEPLEELPVLPAETPVEPAPVGE
jgi:preprotein translocase subunit SecG